MKDYLKNSIIEMAKENEELRYCVDAQQDTIAAANQLIAKIAAANQLIAKLKAEIELLTATIEAAQDSTALELACGTALTDEIPEGDYDLILCLPEVALEERKEQ